MARLIQRRNAIMVIEIDELVNKYYHKLKETDLIIWKYISTHRKACCDYTIYELADACNVSRTTVLRFAQKISLSGYAELKTLLKLDYKQKSTIYINDPKDLISLYHQIVAEMQNKDFTRINQMIYGAKHIFAYGTGNMQNNVLGEMRRLFQCSGDYIISIQGGSELSYLLKNVTPQDLVFIISFSGETPVALDFARNLCARNVPVISITRLKDNLLSSICDENIYVHTMDFQFYSEYHGYRTESAVGYFIAIETLFLQYQQYKASMRTEQEKAITESTSDPKSD